ncbi:MAG: hypothetical protein KDC48_04465 [Planctomycetes bacterium]|nr:hypothetical protein [Planctomycetota bacterium]
MSHPNFLALAFAAAALASLPAQTVDTVGGVNTASTRTNSAKASLFAVDSSVLLIDYEMYLDIPGPETLTFFAYRHHSRSGTAQLAWTHQVTVAGGGGAQWYSTGPIALPLIEGNHYAIGVSWPGTLTYHYSTSTTGTPVSFGSWQRAHTLTNPVPPTLNIPTGVDVAAYNQRLTTLPLPVVDNVGTGCSSTNLVPRLVATGMFGINTTEALELVDATPSSLGMFVIALGPTLAAPLPLFGCDVWLPLGVSASTATVTSGAGYAQQPFPVPNNPLFIGTQFSAQSGVLGAAIDMTNAVDFTVN